MANKFYFGSLKTQIEMRMSVTPIYGNISLKIAYMN